MSAEDQRVFMEELKKAQDVVSHIMKIDIDNAAAKYQDDKVNIMTCMEVTFPL